MGSYIPSSSFLSAFLHRRGSVCDRLLIPPHRSSSGRCECFRSSSRRLGMFQVQGRPHAVLTFWVLQWVFQFQFKTSWDVSGPVQDVLGCFSSSSRRFGMFQVQFKTSWDVSGPVQDVLGVSVGVSVGDSCPVQDVLGCFRSSSRRCGMFQVQFKTLLVIQVQFKTS